MDGLERHDVLVIGGGDERTDHHDLEFSPDVVDFLDGIRCQDSDPQAAVRDHVDQTFGFQLAHDFAGEGAANPELRAERFFSQAAAGFKST